MFDMVAQVCCRDSLVGYELTDRIENITVNLDQFEKLVKNDLVYHVKYYKYDNEIRGILGLNLKGLMIKEFKDDKKHEIININHKVVRYKYDYLIELLQFKHLDYVQIKYFVNEMIKINNENIVKSVMALEKLAGKYNDETCTDIQPFLDKYKNKFDILGYNITNIGNKTLKFRENNRSKYIKLAPGKSAYVNIKEYNNICSLYQINKNNLLTRSEEVIMAVEHATPNKVVEQLNDKERKIILKFSKYKKFKDQIVKEVMRERDYKQYLVTGTTW